MKFNKLNAGIAGCLLAVAISGCDQNSSTSTPATAPEAAKKTADSAPVAGQVVADKAVAEVKPVVEQAVAAVKPAVEKAVQAVTEPVKAPGSEVSGIIAKAQGLVTEKKYKEALTELASLKDAKLTDGQQKIVDELKAQIPKLMSGDTGKAIGNLLGK